MKVDNLELQVHVDSSGLIASLLSLLENRRAFDCFFNASVNRLGCSISPISICSTADLSLEAIDLVIGELVEVPARGAFKFAFHPSDWYLNFITTITSDGNCAANFDVHGWPILEEVRN